MEGREVRVWLRARGLEVVEALDEGRVYHVREHGASRVFKRTSHRELTAYAEVLQALSANAPAGLALPEPVAKGEDPALGPWLLAAWLDGERLVDAPERDVANALIQVNEALASLPESAYAHATALRWGDATWQEVLGRALAEVALTDDERRGIERRLAKLPELLAAGPWRLTNGDLQPANLVRLRDGTIGVVDWDAARWSRLDDVYELAHQSLAMSEEVRAELSERYDEERWKVALLAAALAQRLPVAHLRSVAFA